MSVKLGSIIVELLANTAAFQSGMNKASYEGRKAAKEIHESFREMGNKIGSAAGDALSSLGQFGTVAGELARGLGEAFEGLGKSTNGIGLAITALGSLSVAALAATAGLVELGKSGGELVERLSLISQRTGIGVRDLQVFEAAGKTVGVSLEEMVTGLRRFDSALLNTGKGTASQGVLKELGITSRDNKEALLQTADAFAKMENGARKNADAVALFGKGGLQLIPLLSKGRAGILEWQEAVDKFGPTIGEKSVEALEKHKKSVGELSLAYDKMKVDLEQSVLPVLTKLTNAFNEHGGFQGVLAGLAGGRGAAAILKNQQAAQEGLTEAAKKESAEKEESLRKQEEIGNALQRAFETTKLGGLAAYNLEQARLSLQGAVENGLWKQASAIQAQLPALEQAAKFEAQRAESAKRTAAEMERFKDFVANGAVVRPVLPQKPLEHKELAALFPNLNRTKDPLEGAPDLGPSPLLKSVEGMPDFLKKIEVGKDAVDQFYADWDKNAKGTADSINATYDKQWAHFQGLFNLGEITEERFKDISLKIEAERQAGLKRLRQDNGTSTFKDAWTDMLQEIENSGRDFARSITADIGGAIQSLNQQLAQFVVTGKGLSLKSIGQSLEANLFGSVLRKAESGLAGSLGGLLGLDSSTKPDGSANNPFHVTFDTALAGGGLFGGLGKLFGGGSDDSDSGSGGGLFGFLGSLFGGKRAGGGDVQPGKAYLVGEKRPELFMPRTAGTIVPNMVTGSDKSINVVNHFTINTPDADSFRKSQTQISSAMGAAAQRGLARNGR